MIPRLIASAPRLTKICRPAAARAITCQKRASVPPAFHTYPSKLHQVSKSCSCVGSSTLATGPSGCCNEESSKATSSRISQQTRDNSISVSAAATLLGGHGSDLTAHHYGPPDGTPGTTTSAGPSSGIESFLDENSVLGTLKRINDGAGRKKGRSKKHHKRSDATLSSVRDLLAQLAQQQQTSTATSASTTSPTTSATSNLNAAPTLETARTMPQSCRQMDNTSLMCLAALDVVEARSEVLRRHIMDIDSVSYDEACQTYSEIRDYNNATLSVAHTIPYKLGIATATVAAFASIPLCFHLPSVEYFNTHFVNIDMPDPESLKTWLGVGAWSWEWMEPPLGQLSFMILCLQVARNQLGTMGHKPYGGIVRQWRAERLAKKFPQYDDEILMSYSKCCPLVSGKR